MTYGFKLPDLGEGAAEAEIAAWHVKPGETVAEDQLLVDVMTDKATVEISSPVSGRVLSRHGEVGAMAAIGSEILVIETQAASGKRPGNGHVTPSGIAARRQPIVAEKTPRLAQASGGKILASPAVRARLVALGIDPHEISGSGPEGRIEHADLDGVLIRTRTRVGKSSSSPAADVIDEVKVIGLRRQIAERMLESKRRIPHFSYVEEIDVTALEALRADLNGAVSETGRLTLLPFLILAIVRAIAEHPGVNAHYDDEAGLIRRHSAVHVGVATQTPRGLVVPVVRHAETLSLRVLASEIARLSELARNGKAGRELLTGSTITVSSLGPLGGIMATPIINPPEVAIVGVNKIVERPVVQAGQVAIAKLMNLSSSFDHRVVDGFDAASFIKGIKAELEAPGRLLAA